jgi:N-glycosylase/DNA lyase
MYNSIEDKAVFLPLVVANSIIWYKLSHDDEVYWMNFSKKTSALSIHNTKDMYLFFIDFLPQTSNFEKSYKIKIEHLKEFDSFLEEFFCKQKFYYKNPDKFTEHLDKCITGIPNPKVSIFCTEIFKMSAEIRFKK